MKLLYDRFLIGMVVVTVLAFWQPSWGATQGPLHLEYATKAGVPLIFFLYGALLPLEALKSGAMRWRLHLVVQFGTFVLIPVLVILMDLAARRWMVHDLRLGFFFLGVLPSTVSSSVAMTGAARGDVAGAIFNATLSSLLGVLLTPLWISVLGAGGAAAGPLGAVMRDITYWLG
jgi:solute carrier family 10 (sodium/bile acid cotransporter), member 7